MNEQGVWLMVWLGIVLSGLTICVVIIWRLSRPDHDRANWDTIASWMCFSAMLIGGGGVLFLLQLIHPLLNPNGLLHNFLSEFGIFLAGLGWIGLFLWWFQRNKHRFPPDPEDQYCYQEDEGDTNPDQTPRARLVIID
ncbi:MAG: hypothetical protein WC400_02515 [Patescibacteria group bacterium]